VVLKPPMKMEQSVPKRRHIKFRPGELPRRKHKTSNLLVFYMFRTSYVHLQEDYIVHSALYVMFLCWNHNKRVYKITKYKIL